LTVICQSHGAPNADLVRRRHRGARVAGYMQIRRFCVSWLAIVTTAEEDDRRDPTGESRRRTGSGTSAAGGPPVRFLSGVLSAIFAGGGPGARRAGRPDVSGLKVGDLVLAPFV
jgi:hypothetical protein